MNGRAARLREEYDQSDLKEKSLLYEAFDLNFGACYIDGSGCASAIQGAEEIDADKIYGKIPVFKLVEKRCLELKENCADYAETLKTQRPESE